MSAYEDCEALMASTWTTRQLAGMALSWDFYDDGRTPIWSRIARTQEDARSFYAELDDEELRESAVDALVASGWTRERINFRKS